MRISKGDVITTNKTGRAGVVEQIHVHKHLGQPYYAVQFAWIDNNKKIIEPKTYGWTTVKVEE